MKHKTLIKKMTRKEALEYVSKNPYRLATKEEIQEYAADDNWYWYNNDEIVLDDLYPLFTGNWVANKNKNEIITNTNSLHKVLCIWEFDKKQLEDVLLAFKTNNLSMKDVVQIIIDLL